MDYLLFTLPGCPKCDRVKELFKVRKIQATEYDVSTKDGRNRIRQYIKLLRRDSSGSVIIPTLIIEDNGQATAVLNSAEELDLWLKSRA